MSKTPCIIAELHELADTKIAGHSQRFFKTAPGEYGEGDKFLGIRVPTLRQIASTYKTLSLDDIKPLITSEYHEIRLCGLIMLNNLYTKAKTDAEQTRVFECYITHFEHINNWDLVDTSAPHIVGKHLLNRPRDILYQWATSKHLWTRRIAIVATHWFIRQNDVNDTYSIAELLLSDEHDLIHKAVGWMLREAGKKQPHTLETFLNQHTTHMPRTMLRYAIERLEPSLKQYFMEKKYAT